MLDVPAGLLGKTLLKISLGTLCNANFSQIEMIMN